MQINLPLVYCELTRCSMFDEIDGLYQEVILDHNFKPRNFRKIKDATHRACGNNPLCGDKVEVFLVIENELIKDISFFGDGCAISKASASMMTEFLMFKSKNEAIETFNAFCFLVSGKKCFKGCEVGNLGKIEIFSGVKRFPARVKCATLAWHAMRSAVG